MRLKIFATVTLLVATLGAFQNCSSGSMPNTADTASVAAADTDVLFGSFMVTPTLSSVNVNDQVTFNATFSNVQTISYVCTNSGTGAMINQGTLTPSLTQFTMPIPAAVTCTFNGTGVNLVAPPVSKTVSIAINAPAATAPPPAATPPQTWTWQGLVYQTTCPALCDGVEWASCSGTSCPSAAIQCYTASPKGKPGHPVGTTQLTQPVGYNCSLR